MHGSVHDQNYSSDKLRRRVPILNLRLVFRLTKRCPAGSRKGNRAARRGSAKGKFVPGEEGVAVESGTGRGGDSFLNKHHIYSAVDTAASAASQHGHLVQRCYNMSISAFKSDGRLGCDMLPSSMVTPPSISAAYTHPHVH